jgi:hypothetical protein
MVRQLVERKVSDARNAARALREWIRHLTKPRKRHASDRGLDALGQALEDVERRAQPPAPSPPARPPET